MATRGKSLHYLGSPNKGVSKLGGRDPSVCNARTCQAGCLQKSQISSVRLMASSGWKRVRNDMHDMVVLHNIGINVLVQIRQYLLNLG